MNIGNWIAAIGITLAIVQADLRWVILLPVGVLLSWVLQ